jgi:hypothetical protein
LPGLSCLGLQKLRSDEGMHGWSPVVAKSGTEQKRFPYT